MPFPKDFLWGCAAASYQVEGAVCDDGRGPSVWDMFSHTEGKTWNAHTGDVACDHYHRYREDVALMQEIGLHAYRLSLSWSRVLPEGVGKVNAAGLDFYDRLIDALLAAGVQPFVTLFHWDYPYELFCRGGWLNPDSPNWFADYTKLVVDRLSDRVRHWMTLNEPQCFIGLGHGSGIHAPGEKYRLKEVLRAGHNALLSHGRAVQVIRAGSKSESCIGWAPCGTVNIPASGSPADVAAARRATFAVVNRDCWNDAWWMDPVYLGHYPEDALALYGEQAPDVREHDMETICQPLDFFGTNIYNSTMVRAGQGGEAEVVPYPAGGELTAFRWAVTPSSLYWGPKFYAERYGKPIYITENGMSNVDWKALDGKVHDPVRIDFLTRYLREVRRACEDGVDIRGYFQWSILDNFEWAEGYKERFGLIYVDYRTLERTLKDSAHWYKTVIAANGQNL